MTKPTMRTDLLQPLQVITQLAVDTVGQNLRVFAVDNVALSVEKPGGNLVLRRVLHDRDDSLELFGCEFAGAVARQQMVSCPRWQKSNTACLDPHLPSCRPDWNIADRHL